MRASLARVGRADDANVLASLELDEGAHARAHGAVLLSSRPTMLPKAAIPLEIGAACASESSLVVPRVVAEHAFVGLARSMGGYCGDHAARLAMETLASFALGTVSESELRRLPVLGEPLVRAILLANERVHATQFVEREGQKNLCRGHGCSLAAMRVAADHVVVAHAGDCRVYRFRPSAEQAGLDLALLRLTSDKTIEALSEATDEHGTGRVLVGWVGAEAASFADAHLVAHMPGDLFLLVTDGVHRSLSHADLRLVLAKVGGEDVEAIARAIVDACEVTGEPHETSTGVIVVRVGDAAPALKLASPEDLPKLAPVFQDAYREVPSIEEGSRWLLRATWGSTLAGVATLERHGEHGVVNDLLVSPAWRSRGVDASLLRGLVAVAGGALEAIYLRCAASDAERYAAAGFEPGDGEDAPSIARTPREELEVVLRWRRGA